MMNGKSLSMGVLIGIVALLTGCADVQFSEDGKTLIRTELDCITYVIPEGVKHIGEGAFSDCWSIKIILIPNDVISIGDRAFYRCSGLESITLPDSVTSIGDDAFAECGNLTNIAIPDSVTSILNAFAGCEALIITVSRDSYAAEYCKEKELNYTYPDSNDWLHN